MDSHFASPQFSDDRELAHQIQQLSDHPLLSELLKKFGSMMAILNEHRQILAVNDQFLHSMGYRNPVELHGLRPGNAADCIHSSDPPAGCGTTPFCPSCGAAVAIVSALNEGVPFEKLCAMEVQVGKKKKDLVFQVNTSPLELENRKMILLMMKDITQKHEKALMDRMYIHDTNNMLGGLLGASELLSRENQQSKLVTTIIKATVRLQKEMEIQSLILREEDKTYTQNCEKISMRECLEDLQIMLEHHRVVQNKNIEFPENDLDRVFCSDKSVLLRIMGNMLINALEASQDEQTVKLNFRITKEELYWEVWNPGAIPPEIQKRIFQRNFSTKAEEGRGIGTFSIKTLGERVLHGKVDFRSSEQEGTTFFITVPLSSQ